MFHSCFLECLDFGWLPLNLGVAIVYSPTLMHLTSDDYTIRELLCGQIRVKHQFIFLLFKELVDEDMLGFWM